MLFLIPVLVSLLAGCGAKNTKTVVQQNIVPVNNFEEGTNLTPPVTKGALGEFTLLSPAENAVCSDVPTFRWTASENAMSYTLEVCSSDSFYSGSTTIVYAKETNIQSTTFRLSSTLAFKNIDYYWRVTAVNEYNPRSVGKELVSAVSKFRYEIESVGEIEIGVGEAEDWALHKVGSVADISIDHSDFFGTGDQDSLKIAFEKEHTSQGIPSSDGWIVVQKAVEKDFYGTSGFYCNFYYMGHDSTILIRVIDQDGELWYKQVKFTMDARQIALLKWDEFVLRRGDTVVMNETFDYEHIQAIEVCFEKTFGDGCCMVGGIKAVNYDDYSPYFIKKLDFNLIPLEDWIYESYNFATTISEDGRELTLSYSPLNGYGFAKIPVKRYFSDGNAIKVKIKITGNFDASKTNAIIRIYEPDQDRWSITQPYSQLTVDEFTELTIPYASFEQSSIIEGKRQFYYIENIQFGLNNCYSVGSIVYKDFEIIETPSVSTNPRVVGEDGVIENFDNYQNRLETYSSWETSVDNKDEGIFLSSDDKLTNGSNVYAGKFTYKTDMSMAAYDIYTDVRAEGMNAVKFWIKDASVPNTAEPRFQDYTGDDVAPLVVIQVVFSDGRWYRYNIEKAPRVWTEYIIPFEDFYLQEGYEYPDSEPLVSQNVVNFAFGMQYFYMYNGVGFPLYTQNNPVFMDNIMFANSDSLEVTQLQEWLHPDSNKVTKLDDFEYESDTLLHYKWFGLYDYEYENLELSDDVSSEGGSHSMKLDYKRGNNSPSYGTYPCVGNDSESRTICVDIKGDGVATVYINFYIRANNNTFHQYRHTINNAANGWHRYVIGFGTSLWTAMTGGPALGKVSMQSLHHLTFGVAGGSSGEISSIYVDNISFQYAPGYSANQIIDLE